MLKFEIIYNPQNAAMPLTMNCPKDVNPSLVICLLSQIITALSTAGIAGDPSGLIIPARNLPKGPQ
jgi:hypothetical protein